MALFDTIATPAVKTRYTPPFPPARYQSSTRPYQPLNPSRTACPSPLPTPFTPKPTSPRGQFWPKSALNQPGSKRGRFLGQNWSFLANFWAKPCAPAVLGHQWSSKLRIFAKICKFFKNLQNMQKITPKNLREAPGNLQKGGKNRIFPKKG